MCPVFLDPDSDLEAKLNQIEDYLDLHDPILTSYQEIGWKQLEKIVHDYCIYLIPDDYMKFIIKLSIKLAGVYYSQIRLRESYFRKRKQFKNSEDTFNLYRSIISMIIHRERHIELNVLIEQIDKDHMWDYKQFCIRIFTIYVSVSKRNYETMFEILEIIDTYMGDIEMYLKMRALLNIFSELLTKDKDWYKYEEDLGLKVLHLHIKSIEFHLGLRYGLEIVIKKFLMLSSNEMLLTVIENILDCYCGSTLDILDLRKLEYSIIIATNWYETEECLWTTFKYETLKDVLTLMASPVREKCIFGNETWQNMLDINKNIHNFKHPKIFFNEIEYKLNIHPLNPENNDFIKRYRKEIHLTFFTAIKTHKGDIKIMTMLYTSIALILITIPSDFAAAMLVCLVMNVQKYTLGNCEMTGEESHRIHAVVISIMSLICWLTDSRGLYCYLNKILTLRAYNAPFLNPPLKVTYTYATSYVLWNKPEFFFEIFEVRYALWKRFRLDEKTIYKSVDTESFRLKKRSMRHSSRGSYPIQRRRPHM